MGCWGIVNDMTRCGRIGILPIGILFLLGLVIAVVLGCGESWESSEDAVTRQVTPLKTTAVPAATAAAARAAPRPNRRSGGYLRSGAYRRTCSRVR